MSRTTGHRIFTLLLAIAVIFTYMPFSNLLGYDNTAFAATYSGTLKQSDTGNKLSGKTVEIHVVRYNSKMKDAKQAYLDVGPCVEDGDGGKIHKFEIATGKKDILVYCVEHGVVQRSDKLKAYEKNSSYYAQAYIKDGYEQSIKNMQKVMMFAPTTGSTMKELRDLGYKGSGNLNAWIAASQALIWECGQMQRTDKNFTLKASGLYYQSYFEGPRTKKIPKTHFYNCLNSNAQDIYNFMVKEIKKYEHFDASFASIDKKKPKEIALGEVESYPVTIEVAAGSYGDDLYLAEETSSGGEKKIAKSLAELKYDKANKKYSIIVKSAEVLNKAIMVKHNGAAAKRAEEKFKEDKNLYQLYFWEHKTSQAHTQGMISGLEDPVTGYLKLTNSPPPDEEPERCVPPDVDYFPTFSFPVEKIDKNGGWDDEQHTPMGDAHLNATYTLERNIAGKGWETVDTITLDEYGNEKNLFDQPFVSKDDLEEFLTESGTLTGCAHPIYDSKGNIIGYRHTSPKTPTKRVWDVTVDYRITEYRPEGRYIDPDKYAGERTYQVRYYAETHDTCKYCLDCDALPWTDVDYKVNYDVTKGDGSDYQLGPTTDPKNDPLNQDGDCLEYDLETFVNDCFRGELQLIKSNEKENPFKDSNLGGSDLNISQKSMWTVKLVSGGLEGSEYIHLISGTPKVLPGGTYEYTASRDSGGYVVDPDHPIQVGTNGVLIIKDLPFGRYEVTETSADDPMYVLEHAFVDVQEHNGNNGGRVNDTGLFGGYDKKGTNDIGAVSNGTGDYWNNRYDGNIRDKIKTNKIKVVKVDSETGKTVRMKGTKIFIRYKGNPDYTDEENRKRYGDSGTEVRGIYNRFLPNAEQIDAKSQNYTFELDENGEFIIPYELPYGKYEVLEWLLPEGYYVGEYGADGVAKNHNFGYIQEGQLTVDYDKHGYGATVEQFGIYEADGNKVKYQDKDKYSFENLSEMVTNRYTFDVTKQDDHVDGYYFQKVEYDGTTSENDPSYDKTQFPYTKYYKVAGVINNNVKAKIEIEKKGEALVGFNKVEKDGETIFEPVFEMVSYIKDAVFGIFAAKDETLNDGSEGPKTYDSKTDEEIVIPKEKSSHLSNIVEAVKAFFGKLVNPKTYNAANYETGSYEHETGAQLWYMLERAASKGNVKRTLYLSPEQKDTTYQYAYEMSDNTYNYRWDVEVTLQNQASGRNVTKVNVTKTTSVKNGFTADIPTTEMTGSVGSNILEPITSFIDAGELDWSRKSSLSVDDRTYVFEADGKELVYSDGTEYKDDNFLFGNDEAVDFSKYCSDRYAVKTYSLYKLTKKDLVKEERVAGTHQEVVTPGVDADGDGKFDGPNDTPPVFKTVEDKATRTIFEWDNNCVFEKPGVLNGTAVVKMNDTGEVRIAAIGYYESGDFKPFDSAYKLVNADENGVENVSYTIPEGWNLISFTGNPKEDPHYIMIEKTDDATGEIVRRVLLSDLSVWQECDAAGNFKKAVVQVYEAEYTQEPEDENGFTLNWDGFALASVMDKETGVATTNITKQNSGIYEQVEVGLGYEKETSGDMTTFRTIPISAPIYFKWEDGIRAEMFYRGGVCKTTITLPQSAVDHGYKEIIPILNYVKTDAEGNKALTNLNWYDLLTPENPQVEFNQNTGLANGMLVIAKAHYTTEAGKEAYYTIEITTNQKEDEALRLVFADGYTMDIYCADTENGNGVGVLDLYNIYKTNHYTTSTLIQTLTTDENGKAVSGLLPLGDYIVRELESDDNYDNAGEDRLVSLKWKDQFTPLIWGSSKFDNTYFSVEIDISKVLETAFKSDTFEEPKDGEKVVFGLYAGEEITAAAEGKQKVTKKTVKKDTLIDTVTFTKENLGKALVSAKLPEGKYYFKEIAAPGTHILSDAVYPFVVREDDGDYSAKETFAFTEDGITGKLVQNGEGKVRTYITVESRYPMPTITVDGRSYPLDKEYPYAETTDEQGNVTPADNNGYVRIDVDKDFAEIEVDTVKGKQADITLPNGKVLRVETEDNTYRYTLDGVEKKFIPTVSYTGYHAAYEEIWKRISGENLNDYRRFFSLTGAGTDRADVIVDVDVTHTSSKTVTAKEELIDPSKPELGYETVTVEKGNLTPSGYQIFKHSAVIKVHDKEGLNIIPSQYERTSGKKTVTENLDIGGEIILNTKDTVIFKTTKGASVTVSMDKYGNVKCDIENVLARGFADGENSLLETDGTASDTYVFSKNVTLARQDTSADRMMIKINSDNEDGFAIENDHVPLVKIKKVDKDNHKTTLAGAEFAIYKAKFTDEDDWKCVPGELIGKFTTKADGTASMDLDYGVYFWQETKAPAGYKAEVGYHKFRIAKGENPYIIEVENEKGGDDGGGGHDYFLEITKSDMENGQTLAGAEFEIYGSHKDENCNIVRDEKPYFNQKFVTGEYGKVMIRFTKPGIYYYHETKAPAGYKCDGEYYAVEIGKDGTTVAKVDMVNEKNKEPEIRTTATGKDGEKKIAAGSKVTIVDTVSYYNLEVGKTYLMKGTLMDKATGKTVTVSGKPVTASKVFTPKTKDGKVEMSFTFNATAIKDGSKLVVFEKCYEYDVKTKITGDLIAKHTDINDEGQTVTIKEKPEKPNKPKKPEKPDKPTEVPKTGDKTDLCRWLALIGLALLGMLLSMATLRKKQEESAEEKQE